MILMLPFEIISISLSSEGSDKDDVADADAFAHVIVVSPSLLLPSNVNYAIDLTSHVITNNNNNNLYYQSYI